MNYICKLTFKRDGHTVLREQYNDEEKGQIEFFELLKYHKIPLESISKYTVSTVREVWEANCTVRNITVKLKINNEKI